MLNELKVIEVIIGGGVEIVKGALVFCHYIGRLSDGTKFDSSIDKGKPFEYVAGSKRVIRGWDLGLMGMREGGKRRIEVPAELGYGERTVGKIPPNADLFFEVEVLEVRPRES